jgi:hypothetical protein
MCKAIGFNLIKMGIMKTSKAKTISKPKKTSATSKAVKNKKVTISKSQPSEAEIREKAKEIYHQRIARGEHGTPLDDWYKAEELLKSSKKK